VQVQPAGPNDSTRANSSTRSTSGGNAASSHPELDPRLRAVQIYSGGEIVIQDRLAIGFPQTCRSRWAETETQPGSAVSLMPSVTSLRGEVVVVTALDWYGGRCRARLR